MSEPPSMNPNEPRWASAWITALMAISAALSVGYWSFRGLGEADTEAMESPLMLSVARQLVAGPWELYGPYDGANPLVLIHAPLYYHAAALLAWPLARAGLSPVTAARIAGRLLSVLALAATLAAASRLARLGGRPPRAGSWAALLVAASPLLAGQPFAVRPDMAGVALQSWAVVLTLESLNEGRRRLGSASLLFGLAACVKQHLLAAWAVTAALAALASLRRRATPDALARVVLPGAAVAGLFYGVEWVITGGRVWDAAFVAAANVARVHPGDWDMVLVLFMGIVNRSAGTVALLAAAALIAAGRRHGMLRRISTGVALLVIATILAAEVANLILGSGYSGISIFFSVSLAAALALAGALRSARTSGSVVGVDAALGAYLAAELGLVMLLSHTSAGAWLNYGIPATVFAATLAARCLSRALEAGTTRPAAFAAVLAATVLLMANLTAIKEARWDVLRDRALTDSLYQHTKLPRSSFFFVGRPGFNRLNGRLELVYDDWLYPVFESSGLADPRSRWLRKAMTAGPVRVIVNSSPEPLIAGTALDLRSLHYRPDARLEPYFYVWIR